MDKHDTVLVMRICRKDRSSHGGFVWPEKGVVTATDFEPTIQGGNGLHGWLWGRGDASCIDYWNCEHVFLVVEVNKAEVIYLIGKVKFPSGKVIYCGCRTEAVALIEQRAPQLENPIIAGTATAGVRGTATAGDAGTATAGYAGTATAGYAGTATAGYAGTATAGVRGTATAGDAGTATAGDEGTATAGDEGTATAGYAGTATAGVRGTATAGDAGTATAGYAGTATAGYAGTATAGVRGTVVIKFYDSKSNRYKLAVGYIGEDGMLPNREYVISDGKLVLKGGSK